MTMLKVVPFLLVLLQFLPLSFAVPLDNDSRLDKRVYSVPKKCLSIILGNQDRYNKFFGPKASASYKRSVDHALVKRVDNVIPNYVVCAGPHGENAIQFTRAEIQFALNEGMRHIAANTQVGDNLYPHAYRGAELPDVGNADRGWLITYPLFKNFYAFGAPTQSGNSGVSRVIFDVCGVFAGVLTHEGLTNNALSRCWETDYYGRRVTRPTAGVRFSNPNPPALLHWQPGRRPPIPPPPPGPPPPPSNFGLTEPIPDYASGFYWRGPKRPPPNKVVAESSFASPSPVPSSNSSSSVSSLSSTFPVVSSTSVPSDTTVPTDTSVPPA